MGKKSVRHWLSAAVASAQIAAVASLAVAVPALAEGSKTSELHPHIDLAFCIDTTSSMGSEIENVKQKAKEIVAKIAGGKPSPVIRVGLVAYRDKGDAYVTKVFPFTEDIDKTVKDITSLRAEGGGDTLEAVNEGLHVAVHDLKWSGDKKTLKLLFLIGDAGPHPNDPQYNWKTEAHSAIANGIQINTLGCGSLESDTASTDVFRQIAKLADGKYEALAYKQVIADGSGHKVTVVSSAGKSVRLKSDAPTTAWRGGVRALEESGAAVPMAAAAPMGFAGASAAVTGKLARKTAAVYGDEGAVSAGFGGIAVERNENNLSDLVLDATRQAAKKKLNIDFKDK